MVGCKILDSEDTKAIKTIGWQISHNGMVIPMAKGEQDFNQHTTLRQIFAPNMQAALFNMKMLSEIGIFDEAISLCSQAIDIGWRGRLMGWKALFSPKTWAVSSEKIGDIPNYDKFYIIVKNWKIGRAHV